MTIIKLGKVKLMLSPANSTLYSLVIDGLKYKHPPEIDHSGCSIIYENIALKNREVSHYMAFVDSLFFFHNQPHNIDSTFQYFYFIDTLLVFNIYIR